MKRVFAGLVGLSLFAAPGLTLADWSAGPDPNNEDGFLLRGTSKSAETLTLSCVDDGNISRQIALVWRDPAGLQGHDPYESFHLEITTDAGAKFTSDHATLWANDDGTVESSVGIQFDDPFEKIGAAIGAAKSKVSARVFAADGTLLHAAVFNATGSSKAAVDYAASCPV